jgi:uncharacterized protein (TIGR03435 family)
MKPFQEGSCVSVRPDFANPQGPPLSLPAGQRYCLLDSGLHGPNMLVDAEGITIDELIRFFLIRIDRPVINKSGLMGRFNVHLEFAPSADPSAPELARLQREAGDPTAATLVTAIQEQLGLKLEPGKGPGDSWSSITSNDRRRNNEAHV